MFDAEAIEKLSQSEAISSATGAIAAGLEDTGVVALPNDFNLHDLEKHLLTRRRPRGTMQTSIVDSFADYINAHKEDGATVFVDPQKMTAVGVLNLGTPTDPGHADDLAKLTPDKTAEFLSLLKVTGTGISQQDAAEFIEDWRANIVCTKDGLDVPYPKAVAAIRKITVESKKAGESAVQSFSQQRSTLESITASSADPLPDVIRFKCVPYVGLAERTFEMRVGILTGGASPALMLRIVNKELHEQEMAGELAVKVSNAFTDVPVLIGTYTPKA